MIKLCFTLKFKLRKILEYIPFAKLIFLNFKILNILIFIFIHNEAPIFTEKTMDNKLLYVPIDDMINKNYSLKCLDTNSSEPTTNKSTPGVSKALKPSLGTSVIFSPLSLPSLIMRTYCICQ